MIRRVLLAQAALMLALAAPGAVRAQQAAPEPPAEPASPVRQIAEGVWLVEGSIRPGRGPDGNTVLLESPEGVVVFDTGRNPWHQDSIFAWLEGRGRTPTAIVNSHWHLDHATGNIALKDRYPDLRTFAGDGMDRALTGMLANSLAYNRRVMAGDRGTPVQRQNAARALAALEQGERLKADVVIAASGVRDIGGLTLDVRFSRDAATESDVWLIDPRTGTAVVGDLVTLPSPYLDTACVQGWRDALDEISATPFARLIPGHGPIMDRAGFETYRAAFGAFVDCAASDRTAESCGDDWAAAVAPLLGPGEAERVTARDEAIEYARDLLRVNGGNSAYCYAAERAAARPVTPEAG